MAVYRIVKKYEVVAPKPSLPALPIPDFAFPMIPTFSAPEPPDVGIEIDTDIKFPIGKPALPIPDFAFPSPPIFSKPERPDVGIEIDDSFTFPLGIPALPIPDFLFPILGVTAAFLLFLLQLAINFIAFLIELGIALSIVIAISGAVILFALLSLFVDLGAVFKKLNTPDPDIKFDPDNPDLSIPQFNADSPEFDPNFRGPNFDPNLPIVELEIIVNDATIFERSVDPKDLKPQIIV